MNENVKMLAPLVVKETKPDKSIWRYGLGVEGDIKNYIWQELKAKARNFQEKAQEVRKRKRSVCECF